MHSCPSLDDLRMMCPKVIQYDNDLVTSCLMNQSLEKLMENPIGKAFLVAHPRQFSLIGDRRNHVYFLSGGIVFSNWGFAFWCVTSASVIMAFDTGFVSPMNLSTLLFSFLLDLRIPKLKPLFDFCIITLVSTFNRTLWSEST